MAEQKGRKNGGNGEGAESAAPQAGARRMGVRLAPAGNSDQPQWLAYVGKRRGESGWLAGVYRGEYALYRGPQEREVLTVSREARVDP